jgi:hypothetical protein
MQCYNTLLAEHLPTTEEEKQKKYLLAFLCTSPGVKL